MSDVASLTADLGRLGVVAGDVLFVHSSYKSLGPVEGGAVAVIEALENAVGPGGTILMPSFNLVEQGRRHVVWDIAKTPSTVGYISEFFRTMPGTVRSDHYSHSVAARGARAEWFVGEHRSRAGERSTWDRLPWGKTFGTNSPMRRAMEVGGKVLMLGTDYSSASYCHVVETLWWNELLGTNPGADYVFIDRERMGQWWDRQGRLTFGPVGEARCRLFLIREFVELVLAYVRTGM